MILGLGRAYEKAEDGVHYCEERFLDVARRFGVLGLPARHVPLEDALKAHASQARTRCACMASLTKLRLPYFGGGGGQFEVRPCARQAVSGACAQGACKRTHPYYYAAS